MNAEQYFQQAEKAAARAADLLGGRHGQDSAAVWAALAQAYATLALAAAGRGASGRARPGIPPAVLPAPVARMPYEREMAPGAARAIRRGAA